MKTVRFAKLPQVFILQEPDSTHIERYEKYTVTHLRNPDGEIKGRMMLTAETHTCTIDHDDFDYTSPSITISYNDGKLERINTPLINPCMSRELHSSIRHWGFDGSELLYRSPDGTYWVVYPESRLYNDYVRGCFMSFQRNLIGQYHGTIEIQNASANIWIQALVSFGTITSITVSNIHGDVVFSDNPDKRIKLVDIGVPQIIIDGMKYPNSI